MQHVLPRGFVRIRSFGFLANRHRAERLALIRRLLGLGQAASKPIQAIIVEQARTIIEQGQTITERHEKVQEQELEINELLQRVYRNRSERYREDPNQLMFDFGVTSEVADAAGLADAVAEAEVTVAEHQRRRRKSTKWPAHKRNLIHVRRKQPCSGAPTVPLVDATPQHAVGWRWGDTLAAPVWRAVPCLRGTRVSVWS